MCDAPGVILLPEITSDRYCVIPNSSTPNPSGGEEQDQDAAAVHKKAGDRQQPV